MIFIGFIIGFLGYLPPGNINVTVMQMAISGAKKRMWYFILFASLMEFVYCFGSMIGMGYLLMQPGLILIMKWASVIMFAILAILSFIAKPKAPGTQASGVKRGIVVAIVNPLQIPFWLVWGVYVLNNHWVKPNYASIALFSLITASGALGILWLYSAIGKKMERILSNHQRAVNVVVGLVFVTLGIIELIKIVR